MKKLFLLMFFLIFSVLFTSFVLVFGEEYYAPPVLVNETTTTVESGEHWAPPEEHIEETTTTIEGEYWVPPEEHKEVGWAPPTVYNETKAKEAIERFYKTKAYKECVKFPEEKCYWKPNMISCPPPIGPAPPKEHPEYERYIRSLEENQKRTYLECKWNEKAVPPAVTCRCRFNPNERILVDTSTIRPCNEGTSTGELGYYDPETESCSIDNAMRICPNGVCRMRMVILGSKGPYCFSWIERNYNTMTKTELISPHASYLRGKSSEFEVLFDLSRPTYVYRNWSIQNWIKLAISGTIRVRPLHKFIAWVAGESACYNLEGVSLT